MSRAAFKGEAVDDLRGYVTEHAKREALPALQLALSNGTEVLELAIGCRADSRFCVYSVSKPFFASVVWRLAGTEGFELSSRVGELVPELKAAPVGAVKLSDVMSHMGGFPNAFADPMQLGNKQSRLAAISQWTLEWEPGSQFVYHATSAHWVLAAVVSALTGEEHTDAFHRLFTTDVGIPNRILGVKSPHDYFEPVLLPIADPEAMDSGQWLLALGGAPGMSIGFPGAGCIMSATEVAIAYQAFLRNPGNMWLPEILRYATATVVNTYLDDYAGVSANRSVGFTIAGATHEATRRGFGSRNSPQAFGHGGAGGQIAWADPGTGLSFACVSSGLQLDPRRVEEFEREVSDLAIACLDVNAVP